jgi:uncharacterized membrane protein
MRPSVEEQLQGTCRILEGVVAPCVGDPFARTILDGLIANLRMLTGALPAVAGFLRQDNEATARLLEALSSALAPEQAARIAQALGEAEPDVADSAALDERNRLLRELLAEAVRSEGLTPDLHRAILTHMTERASRVPMRYVPTAPSPIATPSPAKP